MTQTRQPRTVAEWIKWASDRFENANLFFGHGTNNAGDEAAVIVLHVLGRDWRELETIYHDPVPKRCADKLQELTERRINERIPAAYLTGEAWFAGLPFTVNRHVLVPRSPIAELISRAFQPWLDRTPATILDLCTGSGCIGIACALVFDAADVLLTDISREALLVACTNIERYGLTGRVSVMEADVFSGVPGKYDLIVSNPPYVDAKDLASMPDEYRAEPELGLASGEDGLEITRRILKHAGRYLNPGGLLIVEVGNSWETLEQCYPQVAFMWPEFEYGGHGVFILTAEQLEEYASHFSGNEE